MTDKKNHLKHLIACRIFEKELAAVGLRDDDVTTHWMDAALHADPVRMKAEITDCLSRIGPENSGNSGIRFLFGNGCHPDMAAIAGGCCASLPPEKNCIQAFLGPARTKELEQNRTMIISPGWLDAWQDIMSGLGWDEVDVRINMGRYDRILLLDPGLAPLDDEALIRFYDLVQVPVEIMELDLDCFKKFVDGVLAGPDPEQTES